MSKRIRVFHKYSDPGHGWLKVPIKDCSRYGIAASSYSYSRGAYAFLEEDCDMSAFLAVLRNSNVQFKIIEHWTNKQSKIRSY